MFIECYGKFNVGAGNGSKAKRRKNVIARILHHTRPQDESCLCPHFILRKAHSAHCPAIRHSLFMIRIESNDVLQNSRIERTEGEHKKVNETTSNRQNKIGACRLGCKQNTRQISVKIFNSRKRSSSEQTLNKSLFHSAPLRATDGRPPVSTNVRKDMVPKPLHRRFFEPSPPHRETTKPGQVLIAT